MHKSDSSEQQQVESVLLDFLRGKHPDIISTTFKLNNTTFQVDGYSEINQSYYEFYAGVGILKPGQKRKIAADILKLITIEKLQGPISKGIILIDISIQNQLSKSSWISESIRLHQIEIIVCEISEEQQDIIAQAKVRQNIFSID